MILMCPLHSHILRVLGTPPARHQKPGNRTLPTPHRSELALATEMSVQTAPRATRGSLGRPQPTSPGSRCSPPLTPSRCGRPLGPLCSPSTRPGKGKPGRVGGNLGFHCTVAPEHSPPPFSRRRLADPHSRPVPQTHGPFTSKSARPRVGLLVFQSGPRHCASRESSPSAHSPSLLVCPLPHALFLQIGLKDPGDPDRWTLSPDLIAPSPL